MELVYKSLSYAYNPSPWKLRQMDCCVFEVSLWVWSEYQASKDCVARPHLKTLGKNWYLEFIELLACKSITKRFGVELERWLSS